MEVIECMASVRLNYHEMWTIAWKLKDALKISIEEGYNCLQQDEDGECLFFEQEKKILVMIEMFYGLCGRPNEYTYFIKQAIKAFQEKREERAKAKDKDAEDKS